MEKALNSLLMPVLYLIGLGAGPLFAASPQTPFEVSGGTQTPRYAETVQWCAELAAQSDLLHFTSFGKSPHGRVLPLLIADRDGRFTPAQHTGRKDRTVVMIQACIHAGESCGKDAGMILLRDLAASGDSAGLLDNLTILFIPIFNVDGHERFGPYNRINQNGPQEMGWRVTSRNLNLNRDYLKADAPEMRSWLELYLAWLPEFFIDIHSTDGADYQYAITYSLEIHGNMDKGLTEWTRTYQNHLHEVMAADGFPIAPYVSFREWHDPRSGMNAWSAWPRFSTGYTAIQNRPGLLIETHMLKDYPTRVEASRVMVLQTLEWLKTEGPRLRKLVRSADAFTASADFRASAFPVQFRCTDQSTPFEFLGVAYEKVTSEVTGGDWMLFSDQPEIFQLEYYDHLVPEVEVSVPEAYIVPPQWTEIIQRLDAHGVIVSRLAEPTELGIATFRLNDPEWNSRPYEGHHPVNYTVEPLNETRVFPAGSVVVDLAQRSARVAVHLLDPRAPDSLAKWGFFDSIFERAEYVESYVIEQMIQDMLVDNPGLKRELEERKTADPEFAADPWAIRNWFYARTPYYDQRLGIYPVGRLEDRKVMIGLPVIDQDSVSNEKKSEIPRR